MPKKVVPRPSCAQLEHPRFWIFGIFNFLARISLWGYSRDFGEFWWIWEEFWGSKEPHSRFHVSFHDLLLIFKVAQTTTMFAQTLKTLLLISLGGFLLIKHSGNISDIISESWTNMKILDFGDFLWILEDFRGFKEPHSRFQVSFHDLLLIF